MSRYIMVKGQESQQPEQPETPASQPAMPQRYVPPPPAPLPQSAPAWPTNIPGQEMALKALTGQDQSGLWKQTTERVVAELSEVESFALSGRPAPMDLTPLRNAALTRWRLAVALDGRPSPGTPINTTALEAMLTEVDAVLAMLQSPAGGNEQVATAMAGARAALARDAVALSEVAADEAHRVANAAAEAKANKKYQHVARLVSVSTETARKTVRSKAFWVVLAVTVLGTGAYHGYRLTRPPPPMPAAKADLPQGLTGVTDAARGITVIAVLDPSHPPDPTALKELKDKSEASGKALHQVGPGQYIIAPTAMKIPDMSPPPQEPK